jgi:hypothetical protein
MGNASNKWTVSQTYRQLFPKGNKYLWQSLGDLKDETASEITAAQDQALQTKYHATKILQTETKNKGWLRQEFDDTVQHIISACHLLTIELYNRRHDRVWVNCTLT